MEQEIIDMPMTVPHEYEIIDLQREIIKAKGEIISLLKVIIKHYTKQNKEKDKETNETK